MLIALEVRCSNSQTCLTHSFTQTPVIPHTPTPPQSVTTTPENLDLHAPLDDGTRIALQYVFAYSAIWGLGGNLDSATWDKYDVFVRNLFEGERGEEARGRGGPREREKVQRERRRGGHRERVGGNLDSGMPDKYDVFVRNLFEGKSGEERERGGGGRGAEGEDRTERREEIGGGAGTGICMGWPSHRRCVLPVCHMYPCNM